MHHLSPPCLACGWVCPSQTDGSPSVETDLFLYDSTRYSKCIMVAACPVQSFCLQHTPFQQRAFGGGGCTRTEKPTPPVLSLPRPSSLSIRHTEGPEANQAAPTSGRVYQPGQRSGREGSAVMTPCLSSHPPVLGGPSLAPPLLGTGSKPLLLGLSLLSLSLLATQVLRSSPAGRTLTPGPPTTGMLPGALLHLFMLHVPRGRE